MADRIDAARTNAAASLLRHEGIVGIGRNEHSLVVFTSNRAKAEPLVEAWVCQHDVTVELQDVGAFLPADGDV